MLIYQKPTLWDDWHSRGTITVGTVREKPKDKDKSDRDDFIKEEEFKV